MVVIKVLVCGSRGWHDATAMNALIAGFDVLAEGADEELTIIHGGARGADALADSLGKQWNADVVEVPADWDAHGKAAGPIRNAEMLKMEPDIVLAFRSRGKSNGTDDMIRKAAKAGIPTYLIQRIDIDTEEQAAEQAAISSVLEAARKSPAA